MRYQLLRIFIASLCVLSCTPEAKMYQTEWDKLIKSAEHYAFQCSSIPYEEMFSRISVEEVVKRLEAKGTKKQEIRSDALMDILHHALTAALKKGDKSLVSRIANIAKQHSDSSIQIIPLIRNDLEPRMQKEVAQIFSHQQNLLVRFYYLKLIFELEKRSPSEEELKELILMLHGKYYDIADAHHSIPEPLPVIVKDYFLSQIPLERHKDALSLSNDENIRLKIMDNILALLEVPNFPLLRYSDFVLPKDKKVIKEQFELFKDEIYSDS